MGPFLPRGSVLCGGRDLGICAYGVAAVAGDSGYNDAKKCAGAGAGWRGVFWLVNDLMVVQKVLVTAFRLD